MKIRYEFVNGEITEVEVSDEIGEFITSSRIDEELADRRNRRHIAFSLDDDPHNVDEVATDTDPESACLLSDRNDRLSAVLNTLTPTQRRRLKLYATGLSIREIARREGVNHSKVKKSIDLAKKKFLKNF